jgi:hypothetical protein
MALDLYPSLLSPGEHIVETARAVAGGTATHLGRSAFTGVLGGWLYAISISAPLLPSLVLGAMVGGLVGYAIAERSARRPSGPGAVHLVVVLSDERLMTIRRYPTFRQKVLRSYPLDEISSVTLTQFPVAMYHRLTVGLRDGAQLDLVVDDRFNMEITHRERSGNFGVD